jgi:glucose-1-phosphate thymidylyltransferase
MRAIIPVAGEGTRLHPLTRYKPKALVEVAGRPVMEHILDNVVKSGIREVVLIVGYMEDELRSWVNRKFADKLNLTYIHQEKQLGLGHAIHCAGDLLEGNLLIFLGDEIFDRTYSEMIVSHMNSNENDGALGIKHVSAPEHYGMIKINGEGYIRRLVEKPPRFDGDLAVAGVYFIKGGEELKSALDTIIERDKKRGEFQLTDALQIMVDRGSRFSTFDVGEWYDCGRVESLIESNRRLLREFNTIDESSQIEDTKIVGPCYVGPGADISGSILGPFVSIGENATVRESNLQDVILESYTAVHGISGRYGIVTPQTTMFDRKNGGFSKSSV